MSRGILDRIIGYGRTGDVTDSTVRTDGNVSFEEVLGHYDPADHGGEADGSTAGHPPHVADPFGTDPATVAEWATDSRQQGLDAASFVDTYDVAVEATVSAAFEHLREEVGEQDRETVDQVEEHLTTALSDVLGSMQSGVEAFDRTAVAADGGSTADLDVEPVSDAGADEPDREQTAATEAAFPVGYETIMDNIGACLFIVDADGDIVFWNRGAEKLTGVDREEAYQVDIAGQAFYHDGRRAKTLADKVLDAPESAHREYDVPKVDDVDYALYRDQSTMTAAGGEEAHISFSAAPLYDDDGELVGVVEMVNDQTEQVLRREHTADLLSELQRTIEEMQDGNYDERASYQTEGYVDEELLSVVDTLNALGEQFETLSDEVHEEMSALYSSSETVSDASQSISAAAIQQDEAMHEISNEISSLSATVEQIASSATEVDSTSSNAEELAQEGRSSAEEAVDLMDDVADSAEHVATDVDQLRSSIDEIDEIVDVIDAIADQTNILALNASIEAARAGEAGEGFAVVADEVKQLAEESQARAGEIEDLIEKVQADTDETVDNLETTTTRIGDVIDQVEEAMERLEEIDHAIRETSNGIQEVADATDEQAASTEEIASMIDEAAEQADEIAEEIQDIASANQEQADRATELRDTVQEYMD